MIVTLRVHAREELHSYSGNTTGSQRLRNLIDEERDIPVAEHSPQHKGTCMDETDSSAHASACCSMGKCHDNSSSLYTEVMKGCRECVHHAGNTFMMDDVLGCARVRVQYGDDDQKLEVSVDSCPVNCIHWVDREELPTLEFLMQPQPKEGYGIFGGGWERPANVFMAAKAFNKQLKQQADSHQRNASRTVEEETPAQAEARANASMKIKMERFSRLWNWVYGSNKVNQE